MIFAIFAMTTVLPLPKNTARLELREIYGEIKQKFFLLVV